MWEVYVIPHMFVFPQLQPKNGDMQRDILQLIWLAKVSEDDNISEKLLKFPELGTICISHWDLQALGVLVPCLSLCVCLFLLDIQTSSLSQKIRLEKPLSPLGQIFNIIHPSIHLKSTAQCHCLQCCTNALPKLIAQKLLRKSFNVKLHKSIA